MAALLGLLDKRTNVDEIDWHLAGLICEASRAVRQAVRATVAGLDALKARQASERHAQRELHVDQSKEVRALMSGARSIAQAVRQHAGGAGAHGAADGCSRRCLTLATASRHRSLCSIDAMVAEAERQGWIRLVGDRWLPGSQRPA